MMHHVGLAECIYIIHFWI